MILGKSIASLSARFHDRGVLLYHACQLRDLASYLRVGGIPSRALLTAKRLPFTPFVTDKLDRTNGVWDKVFVNLNDFGQSFASGEPLVPNPFGPILLLISPEALLRATSVAVCLRSAGTKGFRRQRESLKTVPEVEQLFVHPATANYSTTTLVHGKSMIRYLFNNQEAQLPEISITLRTQKIPFRHVKALVVDPYKIRDRSLRHWASLLLASTGTPRPVKGRASQRKQLYTELARFLSRHEHYFYLLFMHKKEVSKDLIEWAEQVAANGLDWQYERYARYLTDGTIQPILEARIKALRGA